MWGLLRKSFSAVADLLLPRCCAACGVPFQADPPLCRPCAEGLLDLVGKVSCDRCGTTRGPDLPARADGCPHCPTPAPRFDTVVRLGSYNRPLSEVVNGLKFHRASHVRRWLGRMLAEKVRAAAELASVQAVQAVPLHWLRRLRRSYNQADLIARALADELEVPLAGELIRTRNTRSQLGLSRSSRIANVRGAFAVVQPKRVAGLHLLLVDDVTTTGATADEATRVLLAAGAAGVSLAVLAKTDPLGGPPRQDIAGSPAGPRPGGEGVISG